MVAARHLKHAPCARKLSLFHVLDPGAIHAQGHVILGLASHRAGMAADAFPVIDYKSVSHAKWWSVDLESDSREVPTSRSESSLVALLMKTSPYELPATNPATLKITQRTLISGNEFPSVIPQSLAEAEPDPSIFVAGSSGTSVTSKPGGPTLLRSLAGNVE